MKGYFMIKSLAHICISAKDLNETENFYCSILGLKKKFSFIKNGRVSGYYLQINENNFIEVFQGNANLSEQKSSIGHFCLEVENIDAVINKLKSRGVELGDKKTGCDKSWQVWFKDPNGIGIELHEYTNESSQKTGKDCIVDF
jgi:lactoylglutathione lyase/glyoxylase I family protein